MSDALVLWLPYECMAMRLITSSISAGKTHFGTDWRQSLEFSSLTRVSSEIVSSITDALVLR